MTVDEPAVVTLLDGPATRARNRFMSGLLIGLVVQAGAAVFYAVLTALGPKGCYAGYTAGLALLVTIIVDVLAGVITFWRVSRSNPHHRGAAAAGLALSYLAVPVAVGLYLTWGMTILIQFGCAD